MSLSPSIARADAQDVGEVDAPAHRFHMLACRPVPADRAAPVVRRLRRAIGGRRSAGAGEHAIVALARLGMEFGEIAACDPIIGGRIWVPAPASAADRSDRQNGRASGRAGGGQYVYYLVVAGSIKKKNSTQWRE